MKEVKRHTLAVLVDNEAGVLSRVVRLFSGKGYNIESLAVGTTERPDVSRITIEVLATDAQINWGLFGNVELPTVPYLLCNFRARKLIRLSYRILYCLAELNMIGKYTEVDGEELERVRRDYGRRFG